MSSLRIVFCGDSSVGKTTIINRFSKNEYDDKLQPTVAGVFHKELIQNNNESINLEIWDTAGDERYGAIIPSFFKKADVIIIVFDVTNKSSFDHLNNWIKITEDNAPTDSSFIIVGNKCDMIDERKVSKEDGSSFSLKAKAFGYFETSAVTGEGIIELFSHAATVHSNTIDHSYSITNSGTKERRCC